ncbi:MAG: hypothetical protein PHS80_00125 [Methanothrix sp.]|nr:hypothetical protein [Methanothrix sp.]
MVKVDKKQKVTATISKALVERIDEDRDLVSRSAWIERLLRKAMGEE